MVYQAQFERLELKYLIDEVTAAEIRAAVLPFCDPDPYNGRYGRGYYIGSLYFDSPDFAFYRAKERRDHDRLKLRARVYDATGPVSLEIKRKRGDVIWKQRAAVPRETFMDSVLGFGATVSGTSRQEQVLERFAGTFAKYGAEPKLMVEYEREAYASRMDAYARVTFDRNVTAYATENWAFMENVARTALDTGTSERSASAVILELKAEQFLPQWMISLIHDFELFRIGYSKYNTAVQATLGALWVGDPVFMGLEHA